MTADDDIPEDAGDDQPPMILPWTGHHEVHRIEERRRGERRAHEEALRELSEGQDRLLLRIEEQQAKIEQRRKDIEDNALRLRDGRRVYGDGDRYRDGKGQLLTGPDEAEAARQHEYRRDAPAWAHKQGTDRRAADAQSLKGKILQDRERGQGSPGQASRRLSGYEEEFRDRVEARADSGSADYMADYEVPSVVPAFTAAAIGVTPAHVHKRAKDGSGGASAEMKQPMRGEGEGPVKKARPIDGPGTKPQL